MSQYSKAQEDRMERKLKSIGFEIVEDTARRKKEQGDRVARHIDTGMLLTVDHKSTRGGNFMRIEQRWFDKIKYEAAMGSVPAITLSFFDSRKIYICFDIDDLEGVMY